MASLGYLNLRMYRNFLKGVVYVIEESLKENPCLIEISIWANVALRISNIFYFYLFFIAFGLFRYLVTIRVYYELKVI